MKPNVRARLTSLTNEVVEKSISALEVRRVKIGWSKSIEKPTLKPSNGSKRAHLSPSRTMTGFLMRTKRFGGGLFLDARGLQQEHERTGAAVHDRHFGRGQVDIGVVDAQAGKRRQQVFDRRNAHAILDQRGRQAGVADIFAAGADFDRLGQIHTTEHDARIDRSGTQRHVHLFTGVKANTGRAYHILERTLSDHLFYFPWGQEHAKRAES